MSYPAGLIKKESAFSSGSSSTNALLEGISWTGTTGTAVTIPYSFGISYEGGNLLSSSAQSAALSAMQAWSNVARITFSNVSPPAADLTFSQRNLGSGTAGLTSSLFSGTQYASSEVQVDDEYSNFTPGSFGYLILLHEIGHALGLKHPGNYGGGDLPPFLSASEDTVDLTVMSYNDGNFAANLSNIPVTPMIYDVAAIQYLYGANTSYNSGESFYTYNGGASQALTVWDGGGNDYITALGYSGNAVIDLSEGIGNVTQIGSTYIWVAFGANIENGTGGSGNDRILGNTLNNRLAGREGADEIRGGLGNDIVMGANGTGDLADGNDSIYGGLGSDIMQGNGGNDLIYGGKGVADSIDGGDTIFSGTGNDTVFGNGGNDTIYGGPGNDMLYGGLGNDTFVFASGSGADSVAFEGAGAAAGDQIQITAGINGLAISSASDVLSHISYSGSSALIDLGGGNSITLTNVGAGTLTAEDFLIG